MWKAVSKKLQSTIRKNEGFHILPKTSAILNDSFTEDLDMASKVISALKFALITSVDIDRSFRGIK